MQGAEEYTALTIVKPGVAIAGQFTIEEILGTGGFGAVFLCRGRAGRRYVLKTPLRKRLLEPDALATFRAEVRRWIELGVHPNVLLCFGLVEFLRLPFAVMEFVEGGCSMAEVINRRGTDWKDALRWGCQIARGLEYAYRTSRLLHRDIKPQNVIVNPEGSAKLIDFGLSVAMLTERDGFGGAPVGTPAYAAPELFLESGLNTIRSDLYSLGAALFEVAVGRLCSANLRSRPESVQYPDPRTFQPGIPEPVAGLIMRCTQPAPENRPTDFTALVRELEGLHELCLGEVSASTDPVDTRNKAEQLTDLSVTYYNLGETAKALNAAREALAINSQHEEAWVALGNALTLKEDYSQAVHCFIEASKLNPFDMTPYVNLALAYAKTGERTEALENARHALRIARTSGKIADLENLTFTLLELGEQDFAKELCDEILSSSPLSAITWNNQAILFRRAGSYRDALKSATRATELNPAYGKAWVNRANALIHLGNLQEALADAERALTLDPFLAGGHAAKVTVLVRLGKLREARACLEEGLKLLPDHPLLLKALAHLPGE